MWQARLENYDRNKVVAIIEIPNAANTIVYQDWGYRCVATNAAAQKATYRECGPDEFYIVP